MVCTSNTVHTDAHNSHFHTPHALEQTPVITARLEVSLLDKSLPRETVYGSDAPSTAPTRIVKTRSPPPSKSKTVGGTEGAPWPEDT